jgi:hypothetical protein
MKLENDRKDALKLGTKAASLFRGGVLAASLIALAGASFAQTTPAPQPASSPTPQPSPSTAPPAPQQDDPYNPNPNDRTVRPNQSSDQDNPYADPALHAPKPPEFTSPLGGITGPGEPEAFANLVKLSDLNKAAEQALRNAKACGSKEDIEKAQKAATAAGTDLLYATMEYVHDYSSVLYPTGRPQGAAGEKFDAEFAKVYQAASKAGKFRPTAASCPPPKQDTTGNPPPKPEPAPPPKSGLVDDILGHVSIGVGVGIGGGRRDRDDDRRRDDRRRDDDRTQDSTDKH